MNITPPLAPALTPWRGVVMALAVGMAFASNTSLAALVVGNGHAGQEQGAAVENYNEQTSIPKRRAQLRSRSS